MSLIRPTQGSVLLWHEAGLQARSGSWTLSPSLCFPSIPDPAATPASLGPVLCAVQIPMGWGGHHMRCSLAGVPEALHIVAVLARLCHMQCPPQPVWDSQCPLLPAQDLCYMGQPELLGQPPHAAQLLLQLVSIIHGTRPSLQESTTHASWVPDQLKKLLNQVCCGNREGEEEKVHAPHLACRPAP